MSKSVRKIKLEDIKDPTFLKQLNYKSLNLLCQDIRTEIIKQVSINGGHLASNLGVVELTVALHRSFDFKKDKLLFDVGHQSYTHKILTGRKLDNLNSFDGVSGFIKMSESEYDCFEAGHSSTALSGAEAFAVARDLKKEKYDIVAVVGDSSIANGLSFEALNNISFRNNKVIIVLNDNDMSISRPVGGLSNAFRGISTAKGYNKLKSSYRRTMTKTAIGRGFYSFTKAIKNKIKQWLVSSTIFDDMGFSYIGAIDGHNIKALEKAFARAKNATKSVVIHVITKKGKGYKPAEKDQDGSWHSVGPFDIETGLSKCTCKGKIPFGKAIGSLVSEALKDENNVLICPAMVKGSYLDESFKKFPERCFDTGIAEEHAVTFSGSLALTGLHPIVFLYSTFLQRAYDELSHDCARINSDMTLLVDKAGLIGKNGETHMGIYDEAFLKSIPNVIVSMPSDVSEAKSLLKMSLEKDRGVFAIRYDDHLIDENEIQNDGDDISFLKWKFVQKNENANQAIIAVGPHGKELFEKLQENGYKGILINPIFLNPIDSEAIDGILSTDEIVIYDAYGTENGFNESVEKYLLENSYKGKVKTFALPNVFIAHDTIENQEKRFGVSVNQVFDYIYKK